MTQLAIRKLALTLPTLLVISVVAFSLTLIIPGDAATSIAGEFAPPEVVEAIRDNLGLDQSVPIRYLDWLGGAVTGDFGESFRYNLPVSEVIVQRIAPTLWLAGGAFVITIVLSLTAGVIAAATRGRRTDRVISSLSIGGLAVPEFLAGTLLIYFFAVRLGWLPSSGYVNPLEDPVEGFKYLIIPWVTMAMTSAAALTRMVRSGMLDVLHQDFIRTARAKGVPERIVLRRHALKNSMLAVLTLVGLISRQLIGGAVIVETLFAVPGIGSLLVTSVTSHDYPVVQALVLYIGLGIVLINLGVDLMYGVVDKRVSAS